MDPRRPKKLSAGQAEHVRQDADVQDLYRTRYRLSARIRSEHGFIRNAANIEIHEEYQTLTRDIYSTARAQEQVMLR